MRNELLPMYRELYHMYYMLNTVCWNGRLPDCLLAVSEKQRHSWTNACPVSGAHCPQIAVNSAACRKINDDTFIGILAHEMTHVWQFSLGRRGGHGRDFKKEMLRIGLDIVNQRLFEDSPLVYTIRLYRMRNFNLTTCFSSMNRGDFNLQEQINFFLANRRELFQ